jgi:hypothetical protein
MMWTMKNVIGCTAPLFSSHALTAALWRPVQLLQLARMLQL